MGGYNDHNGCYRRPPYCFYCQFLGNLMVAFTPSLIVRIRLNNRLRRHIFSMVDVYLFPISLQYTVIVFSFLHYLIIDYSCNAAISTNIIVDRCTSGILQKSVYLSLLSN